MTALPEKKKYTPEEYLALEDEAEFRSEYDDGIITAMAGGSLNHIQITFNFAKSVDRKLKGKCRTLPTEMKVYVKTINKFYYPDITIVCDKPIFYEERTDTVTNPKLLVEILSDSTEARDRGEKFFAYQTLESLQEYVLVSQDKHLVETFTKQNDGSWKYLATIGLKSRVNLESVGTNLLLEEIYDLVEFD